MHYAIPMIIPAIINCWRGADLRVQRWHDHLWLLRTPSRWIDSIFSRWTFTSVFGVLSLYLDHFSRSMMWLGWLNSFSLPGFFFFCWREEEVVTWSCSRYMGDRTTSAMENREFIFVYVTVGFFREKTGIFPRWKFLLKYVSFVSGKKFFGYYSWELRLKSRYAISKRNSGEVIRNCAWSSFYPH